LFCCQVDEDEAEEDAPLEKRKKMFTKECEFAQLFLVNVYKKWRVAFSREKNVFF